MRHAGQIGLRVGGLPSKPSIPLHDAPRRSQPHAGARRRMGSSRTRRSFRTTLKPACSRSRPDTCSRPASVALEDRRPCARVTRPPPNSSWPTCTASGRIRGADHPRMLARLQLANIAEQRARAAPAPVASRSRSSATRWTKRRHPRAAVSTSAADGPLQIEHVLTAHPDQGHAALRPRPPVGRRPAARQARRSPHRPARRRQLLASSARS